MAGLSSLWSRSLGVVFSSVALVVGLASVLIAPLVGALVALRRSSGNINTTEASDLWTAMQKFNEDLTDQLRDLRGRVQRLETDNDKLRDENRLLRETVRSLQGEVARLTKENEDLREENKQLRTTVTRIEEQR